MRINEIILENAQTNVNDLQVVAGGLGALQNYLKKNPKSFQHLDQQLNEINFKKALATGAAAATLGLSSLGAHAADLGPTLATCAADYVTASVIAKNAGDMRGATSFANLDQKSYDLAKQSMGPAAEVTFERVKDRNIAMSQRDPVLATNAVMGDIAQCNAILKQVLAK